MQRLPQTTQLLYAELLQQCAVALPNQRGISFVSKTVSGHRYWYMELVVGSTKRQFSLGRDSEALRTQIERQKALFAEAVPDLKQREKLVAMLVTGGAFAPGVSDGRVLEVLAQSGAFLSGGVLVGSHAFNTYGNMLGAVSNCVLRSFMWTFSLHHRDRRRANRCICHTSTAMRIRCGSWSTCWRTARTP